MNKTPKFDAKVKTILDSLKPGERVCELTGKKWELTDEEFGWLKKMNIPPSDRSPLARQRIMAGFMIGYQWWWQKHPKTNKPVLTYVHPATDIKVLPDQEWLDQDFSSVSREYDSSKPFFDQLRELQFDIPLPAARNMIEPENSISLNSYGDVNSYFTVLNSEAQKSFYCVWSDKAVESSFIHNVSVVQQGHYVDDAARIYNSRYIRDCHNIQDSAFLALCSNCENCFGAVNKKRKKFIFFNEQFSEAEYKDRIGKINLRKRSEVEKYMKCFKKLLAEAIWPARNSVDAEGSTGDYLFNTRNCHYCYQSVKSSRDMYRCAFTASDTFDNAYCLSIFGVSDSFGCVDTLDSKSCFFCSAIKQSQDCEYCIQCNNCEFCFGCIGLQRKKFCIFNKQYSEDEYWTKIDEIKTKLLEQGEYGKFFPLRMSPLYFPQSGAVLYFGASEQDAEKLGAPLYDPESMGAIGEELVDASKIRSASEIPDDIDELDSNEWAGVPIMDEQAKRRFAMIKPEIEHYKKFGIAPHNEHPVFRIQDMMRQANLAVFEDRQCANCAKKIVVAKNLEYPRRMIYCRECYNDWLDKNG